MSENKNFVFGKDNYTFIIGGFLITLIGFLLMMGALLKIQTYLTQMKFLVQLELHLLHF